MTHTHACTWITDTACDAMCDSLCNARGNYNAVELTADTVRTHRHHSMRQPSQPCHRPPTSAASLPCAPRCRCCRSTLVTTPQSRRTRRCNNTGGWRPAAHTLARLRTAAPAAFVARPPHVAAACSARLQCSCRTYAAVWEHRQQPCGTHMHAFDRHEHMRRLQCTLHTFAVRQCARSRSHTFRCSEACRSPSYDSRSACTARDSRTCDCMSACA